MKQITTGELRDAMHAMLISEGTREITTGVTTDSRAITPGCVFIALCGERFDGNDYAAEASHKGAAAVVVTRDVDDTDPDCTVLLVEDSLHALQQLAEWWRGQLEPIRVIGLTGSSGKTSTKDMVYSVLSQKFLTVATKGNLNNHIGVPLSILSTPQTAEAAVWEMGMNHAGELAPLCYMTRPQIGVITTIGSAHMEYLGSRENIAKEKCTVARCLPEDGFMVYPAGDDFADMIAKETAAIPLPVGGPRSPVRASNVCCTATGSTYDLCIPELGTIKVTLPVPGEHMVSNSLLAAAVGWKNGCTLEQIAAGLAATAFTRGRLACYEVDGCTVIDDSYNANPESMTAALRTVAALQGPSRCVAVLGRMGELGQGGISAHRDVGRLAADLGFAALVVVGDSCAETDALCEGAAYRIQTCYAPTPTDAAARLREIVRPGDAIIFKGSRSARMELTMYELFPSLNPSSAK